MFHLASSVELVRSYAGFYGLLGVGAMEDARQRAMVQQLGGSSGDGAVMASSHPPHGMAQNFGGQQQQLAQQQQQQQHLQLSSASTSGRSPGGMPQNYGARQSPQGGMQQGMQPGIPSLAGRSASSHGGQHMGNAAVGSSVLSQGGRGSSQNLMEPGMYSGSDMMMHAGQRERPMGDEHAQRHMNMGGGSMSNSRSGSMQNLQQGRGQSVGMVGQGGLMLKQQEAEMQQRRQQQQQQQQQQHALAHQHQQAQLMQSSRAQQQSADAHKAAQQCLSKSMSGVVAAHQKITEALNASNHQSQLARQICSPEVFLTIIASPNIIVNGPNVIIHGANLAHTHTLSMA